MSGCHVPIDPSVMHVKTRDLIAKHEGFRGKPYKDTKGILTIGYGFNLEALEMPRIVADVWIDYLINKIKEQCEQNFSFWSGLNEARQAVLISMAYNIGMMGLLKFRDMIKSLEKHNYASAALAMENSRWYNEVPNRAKELKLIMLSGAFS